MNQDELNAILANHARWLKDADGGVRADLSRANLFGADLFHANLFHANLFHAIGIIDAGQDPRGYRFVGVRQGESMRIYAGCRDFTIEEAERHWTEAGNKDALIRVSLIAHHARKGG